MPIVSPGLRRSVGSPIQHLFRAASFSARLISSLVADLGTGTPTFTRADATPCATHTDFEGIVRVVPANCARFQGARLVRNRTLVNSENMGLCLTTFSGGNTASGNTITFNGGLNTYALQNGVTMALSVGTVVTISAVITAGTKAGTIKFGGQTSGIYATITPSITPTRYAFTYTTALANDYIGFVNGDANTGTVIVTQLQVENVTGQTNQNPSEYVPVGVLSYPYSGSGVDGLLFSPNLNGNTVASNVVTSGTGAAIKQGTAGVSATAPVDASGPLGYLSEGSRTNLITYSNDFTQAAQWTNTASTVAAGGIGVNGSPATKLVSSATSASHVITSLATTSGTAGKAISIYLKAGEYQYAHLTISDNVSGDFQTNINLATGALSTPASSGTWTGQGYTAVSAGNGWWRVIGVGTNATNPIAFVKVEMQQVLTTGVFLGDGTSGIYMCCAQLEQGAFASTYIPTAATAVTRAADVLTYPATGNYSDVPGTIYIEAVSGGVNSANTVLIGTTTSRLIMQNLSTVNLSAVDGTNFSGAATGQTVGTIGKLAHAWTAASHGNMAVNGTVTALTGTFVGSYPAGAPATIYVSGYGAGSTWYGTQRNVRIWPTALTSAQLQAITT